MINRFTALLYLQYHCTLRETRSVQWDLCVSGTQRLNAVKHKVLVLLRRNAAVTFSTSCGSKSNRDLFYCSLCPASTHDLPTVRCFLCLCLCFCFCLTFPPSVSSLCTSIVLEVAKSIDQKKSYTVLPHHARRVCIPNLEPRTI